jgi:hypothetical protein
MQKDTDPEHFWKKRKNNPRFTSNLSVLNASEGHFKQYIIKKRKAIYDEEHEHSMI